MLSFMVGGITHECGMLELVVIYSARLTDRPHGGEWAHNLFLAANDFVSGTWRRYSFESGYSISRSITFRIRGILVP